MNEKTELFKKLAEDLSNNAIQKTSKNQTKKGYDTTGYGYQFCVDRLNELLQDNWGFNWEIIEKIEGKYKSGMPYIEICIKMSIWICEKENSRSCVGGHVSNSFTDALKGAITNAFKKTAAFWGIGSVVYRGELDDDNMPYPEKNENRNGDDFNENKKIYFETIKCLNTKYKEIEIFTKAEIDQHTKNAIAVKDNLKDLRNMHYVIKNMMHDRIDKIERKNNA